MDLKQLQKSAPVNIASVLTDILIMYFCDKYTDLTTENIIYISSSSSIFVNYLGQKLWAFNTTSKKNKNVIKQFIKFLAWEIIFQLILVTRIVIYIINSINKYLKNKTTKEIESSWFCNIVSKEEGEYVLHKNVSIIIKLVIKLLVYIFIDLPMYHKLFN